jgi:hypothetical protein
MHWKHVWSEYSTLKVRRVCGEHMDMLNFSTWSTHNQKKKSSLVLKGVCSWPNVCRTRWLV